MAMDVAGEAYATASPVEWSRPDGELVHQCPTRAISVRPTDDSERVLVPRQQQADAAD